MPLHALARAGLAVTLLLGLVGTAHALTLKSEEFKTHRRPAVTFDHDNHNERAKIEDWIVCHPGGENSVPTKTIIKYGELIEEATGGAVKCDVQYGGTLGAAVVEKVTVMAGRRIETAL